MNLRSIVKVGAGIVAAAALITTAACANSAPEPSAGPANAGQAPAAQAPGSQPRAGDPQSAAYVTDTGSGGATGMQHTISVSATGTASGTPDILTVQLGVQTQAKTAGAALTANNEKAAALIATLGKQGVDKKDITTSDLSIYPSYDNNGNSITGYQVSNMVTVTLRSIDQSGAVIDAAGKAVGDAIRLNQVGFSFSDSSSLRASARADAVKQALAQAQQLADAAGVKLGPIVSISEDSGTVTPQPMYAMADSAAAGAPMPVVAGQSQLAVTVQVVVSIG